MNARDEDQELLARLKEFKVETDLDLLTLNTDLILSRHGDVIDRERLLALIARTREWHAAKTLTGQQDFRIQGQLRQLQFKTGIYQIDKLLDGGLYAGDLVEIAGRPKSGRRSVTFHLLYHMLSSSTSARALWLNTGNVGVDIERLARLFNAKASEAGGQTDTGGKDDAESGTLSLLQRLEIVRLQDCNQAMELISCLDGKMQTEPGTPLRLLVVDDLPALFGPVLGTQQPQGQALFVTFLRMLRLLAQRYRLTVILINGAVSSLPYNEASAFLSTRDKPALGKTLTYMTDMTLWLGMEPFDDRLAGLGSETSPTSHRIVQVFHSRRHSDGRWALWEREGR